MSLIPDQIEAIAHLRDLIEDARNRKKGAADSGNPVEARFGKRQRGMGHGRISGVVNVFGSGAAENLTAGASQNVTGGFDKGGGITDFEDAKRKGQIKLKPSKDPVLDQLRRRVGYARLRCQLAQIRGNKPYYKCLAKNHSKGGCEGLRVTVPCPDVEAAQKALAAYTAGKEINTISDARSGGGGGGGF